ncbi:g2469 [Coccomyxa elongata]
MDVARQKDSELRELLALNKTLPPLFCAPILVKDNFDTIGMAATAGAVGLLDNVASENAFVVQKVIDRGALVLGKFNMGEFALSPDESTGSVFGIVRNPYDLDHTTAGSSGGGAAALAANLALLALGTDTGNSIRGPAAHCGVVGLRPSLGVTSRSGVVPARLNRDTTGPLARTVADAARLFEAMVGYDPKDNLTSLLLQERMDQNYSQFLQVDGLEGARVGVLRQLSDTPTTDPEVLSLFNQAVADMAANGATIVDDFTIDGNDMGLSWSGYLDGKGIAYGFWNVNGSWEDLWNCQVAFPYDFDAYASAPNKTQHFNSLQALYTAGAFHPSVASDLRDALAQRFTPAEYPPPLLRALGFRCGCLDFFTDPCRTEFRRRLVESMDNAEVDVVAFPTWSNPPRLIGDTVSPDGNNSPTIAPHTGAPAITVPMGFTKAGTRLPTGLHLLARPFDEGTLFRVAYAYEQATMHRGGSPIFPELLRGSGNVSAQSSASSVPFSG